VNVNLFRTVGVFSWKKPGFTLPNHREYTSVQLSYLVPHGLLTTHVEHPSKGLDHQRRRLSTAWRGKRSPYEILGVDRNSSPKDVKIAYFREAKKYHPDLNPNNPDATRKFQEVAAAYEILSDPKRKAMFDATGWTGEQQSYTKQGAQQHAEDIFTTVQEDFDVVKDALASYGEEMMDELHYAVESMRRGDWKGVWEVASSHKGIIFGIVVPTFLIIRFPPAVFAIFRFGGVIANIIVAGLAYTGNVQYVARLIWRQIIRLSQEQQQRAKNRRRTY
jgi:hypothetical protein